jgi:hypothetical protein
VDNPDTEFLFPIRVVPSLVDIRSDGWKELIRKILETGEQSNERIALTLVMVRLNGCSTCNSDSYRAMRGCTACSTQSLRRFHGTDDELVCQYNNAIKEVVQYFQRIQSR